MTQVVLSAASCLSCAPRLVIDFIAAEQNKIWSPNREYDTGLNPCDINRCREQLQKSRRNSVSGFGCVIYRIRDIVLAVLLAYESLF